MFSRPFTIPQVLRKGNKAEEEEGEEEEEEDVLQVLKSHRSQTLRTFYLLVFNGAVPTWSFKSGFTRTSSRFNVLVDTFDESRLSWLTLGLLINFVVKS